MTGSTRLSGQRPIPDDSAGADASLDPAVRVVVGLAAALGVVGAVLTPVRALSGPSPEAGFMAWPMLIVLAVVPAVLVLVLAARAPAVAAGIVAALAVLAPGRLVIDLQLVVEAGVAARPELLIPAGLAPITAGPGVWAMLAANLLWFVAGVVLLVRSRDTAEYREARADLTAGPARQGLLVGVLVVITLITMGLLSTPYASDTGFLPARSPFDGPSTALVGVVLLAGSAAVFAVVLVGSADPGRRRGGLLGLALGVLAVAFPVALAGFVATDLRPAPGPWWAVAAAVGAAALAIPAGRVPAEGRPVPTRLPAGVGLHRAAGLAALLTGVTALLASRTAVVRVPDGVVEPSISATWLLVPAALTMVVPGLALAIGGSRAAVARPVVAIACAAPIVAGGPMLAAALTATEVPGVRLGLGTALLIVTGVVAVLTGILALAAGGAERDDVDLGALADRDIDRPAAVALLVAAVAAVVAFALPVASGADIAVGSLVPPSGVSAWGLVVGLGAVLGAAVIAIRARPVRSVAVVAGAGLVLLVRMAEYPIVAAPAGGGPAAGTWAGLGCLVALAVSAVLLVRLDDPSWPTSPQPRATSARRPG